MMVKYDKFKVLSLTLLLTNGFAYAQESKENTEQVTTLSTIQAGYFEGAKSQTNVVELRGIEKSTATDLRGILAAEPAINFGGGNSTSQWYSIRGMGQDQIDVKVDNTYSDTQIFHHQGRFLFDPALVKIIDVQKGTGSASAGLGATSGAIVATTVDAADLLRDGQNIGVKVNTGYSSNKGANAGGAVYGRFGKVDALFATNFVREEDYKDGSGYKVNASGIHQRGVLAKIGLNFNENHRLAFSYRQEKSWGVRNLREEFDFALADNPSNNRPSYRVLDQETFNLEYHGKKIGFIDHLDANVYQLNNRRLQDGGNSITKVETTGANFNFNTQIFGKHWLKYGLNYRRQTGEAPTVARFATGTHGKDEIGAYLEGIWNFDPITLTTGLRYDHFDYKGTIGQSVSDGAWSPSIGLIWDATHDLSFNMSYNIATRSPRLFEVALVSTGRGGAQYIAAGNGLKAERSRNFEVGFDYRFNDQFSAHGSYFVQKITNLTEFETSRYRGAALQTAINGGELKNRGYELGLAYKYAGLQARVGVAYSKPEQNGSLADIVQTAIPMGRTWTASLSYTFENPSLELGWQGRFVQRSEGQASRGSGGAEVQPRPGYGVSDIYLNWQPTGKDDINVNVSVNNVFNKYYKPHSQRTGINALPAAGRDYRLNISYRY
ncbi:TonB-dependent receptor domain-containing protein [Pelistega sp. MC2]|uniref:TonB-dependent receptor domain-containing protein n=1 Tax=Pelistega sp. MC2 TaxID=1720297 RepID=UPI0009F50341|nr:TonB-dependent receptor [Pelistega sp. MC2]